MHELATQIEAILFVSGRALTVAELAAAIGAPMEDISAGLELLQTKLEDHGLRLVRAGNRVELVTTPEMGELVERFLQAETATPLSKPALETLAIIAHRQPVSKPQIEAVRGIASDQTLRNLLGRGLIEEVGRSPEPGRPTCYGTTTALLRQLGVAALSELEWPDWPEDHAD